MKEKCFEWSFCRTIFIGGVIVVLIGILLLGIFGSIKTSNAFEASKCDCSICENRSDVTGDYSDLDWRDSDETKN